ncbi:MAG: NAD(P)/FAD-dependent oxidoreductase [Bacteroidota bacterium]
MDQAVLDVVIIGAGHAGLSISKLLADHLLTHQVFERGKTGESWRSQRWHAFRLNSNNRLSLLPGQTPIFADPEAFPSAPEYVAQLEAYVQEYHLPVVEHATVTRVTKDTTSNLFVTTVLISGQLQTYYSRQVVVASGGQNKPAIPRFAEQLDTGIVQMHASAYRHAAQLPEGAVLVAGSAQSGTQVAEDLANTGRKVFLCTSQAGRIPRTYRGRDIFDWLLGMGLYDLLREDASPEMLQTRPPQVSGTGIRGKTCSLQSLAGQGVVILGKAEHIDGDVFYLQPNAAQHVRFADTFSANLKKAIEDYIREQQLVVPAAEIDPNDQPDETASCVTGCTQLSLQDNHITSVIWATGFRGDFSYLDPLVLNDDNTPKHEHGISGVDGLYFLGLPWLRKRKSGIIPGIGDDAAFIAGQILQFRERYPS